MATPAQFAANTARSYALVGFIFYLLGAVGWGIGLLVFLVTLPFRVGGVVQPVFIAFPVIIPFGVFSALSIGFAWWSWTTLHQIEQGRYADARTSSLILGIFGIFLAFLIGGIFFLLAYGELETLLQPRVGIPAAPPPGPSPVQRFCTNCGRAAAGDAKFCSHCGKELPA